MSEPQLDEVVVAVRELGSGQPIHMEPGDRVRLVIEGNVESLQEGFLGLGRLVIVTDAGRRFEPNHPTLAVDRIERLAPRVDEDA